MSDPTPSLIDTVRQVAYPLTGTATDYDSLLALIGNARFVLLGEASHGTHEFYRERAQITKRLIIEKGFTAVAVEADWPDAYRVDRYIRGANDDADSTEALSGFQRFPAWMWRNADVLDFVGWLRTHNEEMHSHTTQVGFYGLDLYSLYGSIAAVLTYLDKVDPEAAQRARYRYLSISVKIVKRTATQRALTSPNRVKMRSSPNSVSYNAALLSMPGVTAGSLQMNFSMRSRMPGS